MSNCKGFEARLNGEVWSAVSTWETREAGTLTLWSSCVSTQMNGIQQYLPFQAAGGKIVAYRRGLYAFVRTDFGLLVGYNWDTHVTTKVPSNYAKAVCGLCGNFNGNAQDDLGPQNQSLALDPQDFGRKWLVATRPGCRTDEQRVCPNMNRDIVKLNNEQCRVLSNRQGHFKHCWKDPTFNSALIECIYDNCRMPGQSKPLCDSLATYTAICQDHDIVVYPWRTKELCREYQEHHPG